MTRIVIEDRLQELRDSVSPEVWAEGCAFAQDGRIYDAGFRRFRGAAGDFDCVCARLMLRDSTVMIPWFRVLDDGGVHVGCSCITAQNMRTCSHIVAVYIHCEEMINRY